MVVGRRGRRIDGCGVARASDDGRRRPGCRVLKRRGRDIAATVDATQTTVLQVLRLRRASGVASSTAATAGLRTYRVADAHLRMLDRRAEWRHEAAG